MFEYSLSRFLLNSTLLDLKKLIIKEKSFWVFRQMSEIRRSNWYFSQNRLLLSLNSILILVNRKNVLANSETWAIAYLIFSGKPNVLMCLSNIIILKRNFHFLNFISLRKLLINFEVCQKRQGNKGQKIRMIRWMPKKKCYK